MSLICFRSVADYGSAHGGLRLSSRQRSARLPLIVVVTTETSLHFYVSRILFFLFL